MKNILIVIVSLIISGCSDYEVEEYNMLSVYGGVYASYYSQESKVKVITTLDNFDAKGIGKCSWINLRCDYSYVNVSVSENKSTEDRECFVEVYNDRYNLRDTFCVYQYGMPTTVESGNGGGGSVGGSSGTNVTSRRCAAITKKGTRCERTAAKGSIYCWQHKK